MASAGYANGLVNAIAAVVIGWAVDRYELRRTWVIGAGCLLLGGMMVLEVRGSWAWGLVAMPVSAVHTHSVEVLWHCMDSGRLCLREGPAGHHCQRRALHG